MKNCSATILLRSCLPLLLAGCLLVQGLHAQVVPKVSLSPARQNRLKTEVSKLAAANQLAKDSSLVVKGTLVSPHGSGPEIALGNGVSLPVANAEAVARLPEGVGFEFTVKPTDTGTSVLVAGQELGSVAAWKEVSTLLPRDDFKDLHASMDKLEATAETLAAQGSMGAKLNTQESRSRAEIIRAFMRTDPQEKIKRQALSSAFQATQKPTGKAQYGRDDTYPPAVYPRIHCTSQVAVALARAGQNRAEGSGVLIGNSLVLTCRHVVEEKFPSVGQMRVWFDYEEGRTRQDFAVDKVLLSRPAATGSQEPLDFALVLLKADTQEKQALLAGYSPAVLSSDDPQRNDPIYVAGHPEGGRKKVHDHAFVMFPFRVSAFQRAELELIVMGEVEGSPNRTEELQQFINSYRPVGADSARFEQYSERWNRKPAIAADCDTFHGNSGSAACDRRNNKVVGLLFDGEHDVFGESYQPGWRRHEAILPISLVIQEVNDWRAVEWQNTPLNGTWVNHFNVKIE